MPAGLKVLNAELNPIYHLLALLGAHRMLHISRVRVNGRCKNFKISLVISLESDNLFGFREGIILLILASVMGIILMLEKFPGN
jgi:hypothetical protein